MSFDINAVLNSQIQSSSPYTMTPKDEDFVAPESWNTYYAANNPVVAPTYTQSYSDIVNNFAGGVAGVAGSAWNAANAIATIGKTGLGSIPIALGKSIAGQNPLHANPMDILKSGEQLALGNPLGAIGSATNAHVDPTTFLKNLEQELASKTYWEQSSGKSLTDKTGGVDWTNFRQFLGDAMSAPMYAYGGSEIASSLTAEGAPLAARMLGMGIQNIAPGALGGAISTLESKDWADPSAYLGSALTSGSVGFGLGAATGLIGGAIGDAFRNAKIRGQLSDLGIATNDIKNMSKEDAAKILSLNGSKGTIKQVIDANNAKIAEAAAAKSSGAVKTDLGKNVDEFVNKVKSAFENAKDVTEKNKVINAQKLMEAEHAREGATDAVTGASAYMKALAGKQADRTIEPLQLSPEAKTEVMQLIGNMSGVKAPAYTAMDKLEKGIVPFTSELKSLSNAIGYDVNKLVKPQTIGQKIGSGLTDIGNASRKLLHVGALTAPGKQAFPAVAKDVFTHPIALLDRIKTSYQYLTNPKAFDDLQKSIADDPLTAYITSHGGFFSKLGGNVYGTQEELAAGGNILKKIPIVGDVTDASMRQQVGFLNSERMYQYKMNYQSLVDQGLDPVKDGKVFSSVFKVIDASTGHAAVPKVLEKSADTINALAFSPKLMYSRLFYLNPANYLSPSIPAQAKVLAAKQMASTLSFGFGLLALAKMGGATVETDPRSSAFGKAKWGNTTVEFFGSFQPYVRLAAQEITGQTLNSNTGKITNMDTTFGGPTRLSTAVDFARGKLSPIAGDILSVGTGTDAMGNQTTLPGIVSQSISPLAWQNTMAAVLDAKPQEQWPTLFKTAVASHLGVGVTTYDSTSNNDTKKSENSFINTVKTKGDLGSDLYFRLTGKIPSQYQ